MKKFLFLVLISVMSVNSLVAQVGITPIHSFAPTVVASGYCGAQGDNLTWTLTCDSVLTISGNGDMMDYVLFTGFAPWFPHESAIRAVVIRNGVTSIGNAAFGHHRRLSSVTIPNSVTSIGDLAFAHARALTSVIIPKSVTTIGHFAFGACRALTSIDVDINNQYFSSENGVLFDKSKTTLIQYPPGKPNTVYIIPNSVTTIGNEAFFQSRNLISVVIPEGVTNIGNSAFSGCSGLTSIVIPNSVVAIGNQAFFACSNLTSVIIGDGAISIGDRAFANCRNLTSVTIGKSVKTIGEQAFSSCRNLTSITCYALTPPTLSVAAFNGVNKESVSLYVPEKSIELYRGDEHWSHFQTIIKIETK